MDGGVVMKTSPSLSGHGVEEWYMQRLSAVLILLLLPIALSLVVAVYHGTLTLNELQAWLHAPATRVFHSLFALALVAHAYLGVKVMVEDYIHKALMRLVMIAIMQVASVLLLLGWLTAIWW
jgi:succinate dehydrogenase / fumarate reductase membrane anchor subunit